MALCGANYLVDRHGRNIDAIYREMPGMYIGHLVAKERVSKKEFWFWLDEVREAYARTDYRKKCLILA